MNRKLSAGWSLEEKHFVNNMFKKVNVFSEAFHSEVYKIPVRNTSLILNLKVIYGAQEG